MSPITLIYIFMTALFSALLMVPFLHRWALDRNMLDEPDERKFHQQAVPRLGGIAICFAFIITMLVYADLSRGIRGILAGALVMFITGLLDDLSGISSRRKFFGEICAALTTMAVGHIYIRTLGDLFGIGEIVLPLWLAIPFTLVAIVGVVNAFNLIDGLDGLAGGVSVITLVAFGLLAYFSGNSEVVVVCAALLGGLLGFLKYNFYPARIFMGDTGSLVAGFVISFLAIMLTQCEACEIQPVVPLLIIGLPVADTLWVMIRRVLEGHSPFSADRTHLHHKFLDLGLQHRYTVILIYGISLFWAAVAVFFYDAPAWCLFSGYFLLTLLFYLTIRYLQRHRTLLRFIGHDSTAGIRDSLTYRRLASLVAGTAPLMQIMVLAYLILAVVASSMMGNSFPKLMLVFLVACSGLLYLTRDYCNHFVLAMFYGAGMVISFVVTQSGQVEFPPHMPLRHMGDMLLLGLSLLMLLRLFFRRMGDFYLTSIDYLLLGVSLFLAMVTPQITDQIVLTGVLVRGIIFYAALKVIAAKGERPARRMSFAILGAMLLMVVFGYLR